MKGIIKKSFVLMLALTVLFSAVPLSGFVGIEPTGLFSLRASAVEETEETISGTVGTKLSWSIDKASGVLTIDNTGDMISFASDDAPWKQYSGYITSAKINEGCTSIGSKALSNCSKLKSVTLPDSLTSIGSSAFYNCASLVNITIPDSVTNIGEHAFSSCTSLAGIDIPDSVRSIGNWAFYYCTSLTSAKIGNGVTNIGYSTFEECTNISVISISNSVTRISSRAFFGCDSLSSIIIPYSCKYIYNNAFSNCTNLSKITIYSKDCSIDETAISIYSTIYGFSGSTAEAFANQYGYAFVSIDTPCEHEYSNACDDTCNICGEKRDTAHSFGEWETVKESSCSESGEAKRVCSVCGTVETKKLDLLEHTDENGDGICEVCKKQFIIVYPMNGVCGENLTWELDENGVLTIEGTGTMYDFSEYRDYIRINNNPSSGSDDPSDSRLTTKSTTSDDPTDPRVTTTKVYEPTTRSPEITTTTREYTTEFNTRTTQPDQEIITHPYGIYTTAYELTVTRPDTTKRQEITTVPSTTSPSTTVPSTTAPASSARVARMASASYETTTNPYGPEDGYTKIYRWNLHFDEIKEVIIGEGVTSIGTYAFYNCKNLESVTIPKSVTGINRYAFSGCLGMTTVNFNAENCSINSNVFNNCAIITLNIGANVNRLPKIYTIETATFAEGANKIPDYAFSGCYNLKSVTIPNTVTNIGREAFYNCSSLESITIPEKVTYIGSEAFCDCSNLTTVNFNAESCGQIGYYAFSYCPIKVLNIGANVDYLPDINTLETVTLINGATKIPDYAFSGCTNLKSVTIPDSVTSIGDGAFQNCSNLENIEIPDGVKIIGNRVFNYCSKLRIIKLPDKLEKIGNYSFFACKLLNSVDLPSTLISIGYSAFDNCYGITEINLPNGIEIIGDFAFYACTSLSSVTVPESVKSLGYASFGACYSLSSVELNAVECFAKNGTPFYCSENISSVTFGSGIKRIPEAFLLGKTGVSYVDIPASVIEIGDYAFSGTSVIRVDLPEGVEVIGRSAFSNLYEAKELSIPKSVVLIGKNAFANTVSLGEIKFNAVNAELSNQYYGDVFANSGICSDGIKVVFGENVEKVPAYLFEVGSETAYPNITSVLIGSKVKAIGDYAFYHCASIGSVKFGESLETLGAHSFDGCFEIKNIQLPQSLKTIGEYAFYDCRGLTTLTIPEAVKYIGVNAFGNCHLINTINYNAANCEIDRIGLSYAFTDCENVMFVNIGESVNSLPAYAFSGCENLERINIPDIVININPLAFYGCKDAAIVCASGSYGNAFAVQNGMKYVLSDKISGTAFEIKNGMLLEYNGIAENVVLPSEITSIGIDAFKGNSVIKSVEIPYNISKIYSGAFANCPNLERVIIPFTVTDISSSAFTGTNAEIYCYSNSYAYNYAVANNIEYELITVTLSQSDLYIVEGESIRVKAIPSVTLASGLPIVWKSSNASVASVDSQGNIVGVSSGSTNVGAYSISGVLLDECTVSVEEPTEIEFKQASTNSLKYGEKLILHINASNMPDGASIKWSSSNDKIVKLSGENNECEIHDGCITCTVESVGTGKAEIKATVVDSDGNPIIQNGNEVSTSFEINSKAGLWQKIVAFFKKLFRISRTIIQSI